MSATLLKTWTAPARTRSLTSDALLALPITLALAAVAARLWGLPICAAVLLLGLAATVGIALRRAARFDRPWLVRALDATRPDMEDSSDLLFTDPQSLSALQALQRTRLESRLTHGSPQRLAPAWSRRRIAAAWIIAALTIAAAVFWPRGEDRPVILSPSAEGGPAVAGAPRLIAQ
ncbi:MAG: hypothetical protein JWR59_2065, partial [Brevundimonas sp.]|nr:hypothetical protein [Brevundimonas sp.]